MRRLKQQKSADSTWQAPPVRQWRIKFFASLCLLAFMAGLMLGKVFKPDPAGPGRLLQVVGQDAGLLLCFSRLPQVTAVDGQGAYVLLFAGITGTEQSGSLQLATGQPVSWRFAARADGLQLGLVSLQPLAGSWQPQSGRNRNCLQVQVQVQVRPDADLQAKEAKASGDGRQGQGDTR